jgi:hypothetical protein
MDVLFDWMPWIGQRGTWLIAGVVAAAVPSLWMWGFTVDDALISVRYARHVASGVGWRFDVGGPATDGVTPLPWPLLLAPLARADALTVLARSQVLGLLAWCAAGGALGRAIGARQGAPAWARAAALLALALSMPVAAHAVTGMETAVATSLATFAALETRRPRVAAALAGAAAALRPELAPWACILPFGLALAARRGVGQAVAAAAIGLGPFAACALVRLVVWGRPGPLALLAKPTDLGQGLDYAGAACVAAVVPLLVLAPWALRRAPVALVIALAGVAHVLAIAAAGGDWMHYFRLIVPVVPSLAWAAVLASEQAHPLATAGRSVLAVSLGILLVVLDHGGAAWRRVGPDRAALVRAARLPLEGCARVAALDVGWVGAATEGDILDLAGVTDPEIAVLPGGHTSKRVDGIVLVDRGADALLLYAPAGLPAGGLAAWTDARYGRVVEARLAADATVVHRFEPAAWLADGAGGAGYVLLRARP